MARFAASGAASRPAAAASTSPSPLPLTSSGAAVVAVRTIGCGRVTPKTANAGGSGAFTGVPRASSSSKGMRGVSVTGGPKARGAVSPAGTGLVNSAQVGTGRGVRKRSYCWLLRRTMSPTLISRAMSASPSVSNTPSCNRRSSARSRSADAAAPNGISSRTRYGRFARPGRTGSRVVPQR